METKVVDLTDEWLKGSDGVSVSDLRVESGVVLFALSVDTPAADGAAHTLVPGEWVKITPPLIGWFKAMTPGAYLSKSTYAA